ncbi:ATP-grasp domain-containing protein [Streptomyces sp. 4N509B]|uniref:ATP-grasp domain-containing protein n=1 Tax=Streptomyces sp. 4N509B TaxID=3457413 RepID=UPI003FD6A5A2
MGGPNVPTLARSLSGLVECVWVYRADEVANAARDLPIMAETGRTVVADDDDRTVELLRHESADAPLDGVLTLSENKLGLASRIAAEHGLRFNTPEAVHRLTNKYAQRQALAASVPVPRFALITDTASLSEGADHVGFPAVLKPVRGGGSKLTTLVRDLAELQQSWATALEYFQGPPSRATRLLRSVGRPQMLLEEQLVGTRDWHTEPRLGDYVSVDSTVWDGVVTHVMTMDKLPQSEGFRERAHITPSMLPAGRQAEIHAMTSAALAALGVTQGMTHTELKLTASGPRIIEVNGRPSGASHGILMAAAGYDLVAESARACLGERPMAEPVYTGAGGFLTPCVPGELSGRPVRITFDPGVSSLDGVLEFYDMGVTSFDLGLGQGYAAMVYAQADTPAGLLDLNDKIVAGMNITVGELPEER